MTEETKKADMEDTKEEDVELGLKKTDQELNKYGRTIEEETELCFQEMISTLPWSHRKRVDLKWGPIPWKWCYGTIYLGLITMTYAQTVGTSLYLGYMLWWSENKYFSTEIYTTEECQKNMFKVIINDPKYLSPYVVACMNTVFIYSYANFCPGAWKWIHLTYLKKFVKNYSQMQMRNVVGSIDSSGENMRTWFIHIVLFSYLCAFFVSPRWAAIMILMFSTCRLINPWSFMFEKPLLQWVFSQACGFVVPAWGMRLVVLNYLEIVPKDSVPSFLQNESILLW